MKFLFATIGSGVLVAVVVLTTLTPTTHAAITDNLSGYAWSSNIGWISFNCTNTNTCLTSPYGVSVAADGTLSGYAWSSNIGWISFNAADVSGCPSGICTPKFSGTTGQVSGWARALAGTGLSNGGWDGWIHLGGTGYDVTASGCNWGGYAWGGGTDTGSSVVGWIHFSGTGYGVVGTGTACSLPTAILLANGAAGVTILSGQPVKLTWSSTNATSCTGIGFSTGGATSNLAPGVSVSPLVTSSYQVRCDGLGGTGYSLPVTTITVLVPTAAISATPSRVQSGGSTTVSWNAQNVNSCDITKNGNPWKSNLKGANLISSATDSITVQTTYLMTCKNVVAQVVASATTTVNIAPKYNEF
ncbi:MAG: hypothetical protein ACYCZZ_01700 [Minisyncoccota bacterium]